MDLNNRSRTLAIQLLRSTPFYPTHMGQYLREKYFFRHLQKLPVASFSRVLDAGCGPGTSNSRWPRKAGFEARLRSGLS